MGALDTALADAGTAVVSQVLTGMGGVGKTQLAARHARNVWRTGRLDLLVWVTATSRQSVIDAFAEAAETVLQADRDDPERAARAFLAWLEPKPVPEPPRWLVVLDDVTDPADLRGLWPADSPNGRTVVTTRSRDAALTGRGRRQVTVGLFSQEESEGYLTAALAGHDREPLSELMALGADLGWLPLAMSQATAYIVDAGTTCAGYRALLADRARRFADLRPAALPDDQTTSVAAAWALSVDRAVQYTPAGIARPLLQLVSMLDPHGIPEAILTSAPARTWLAQDVADVTKEEVLGALRVLHRLSMLDHAPRTPHQAVRVHRLIQRTMRDTMSVEEQDVLARIAADAVLSAWPEVEREIDLSQALRASAGALTRIAEGALYEPGTHDVLHRTARSLGEAGRVAEAGDYFEHVVEVTRIRLGPDHLDTFSARAGLANWRGEAGDVTGAAAALANLHDDMQRALGLYHPDTLALRPLLARWRGEARRAIRSVQQPRSRR